MKTCSKCKLEKSYTEFHLNKNKSDGYSYMCKVCRKDYSRNHYTDNKESYLNRSSKWKSENSTRVLATKYKTSIQVVEDIMSVGSCEICGSSTNLVFDHIHKTNTPRGCLCSSCNLMIGQLGDSNSEIEITISKVLKYINKNN